MKKYQLLIRRGIRFFTLYRTVHNINNFKTISSVRDFVTINMSAGEKWKTEKNNIFVLPIAEKRKLYANENYITEIKIQRWDEYYQNHENIASKKPNLDDIAKFKQFTLDHSKTKDLNRKIALFKGDITQLEIDAIVNAANSRLRAGGGVDGAIHRAAGQYLQDECNTLGGCPTGSAKITGGYNLPAKYVIHTVGPQDGSEDMLRACYEKCLSFQKQYNIKYIAFPCISTGIYGFPNRLAAHIALQTVRKFLETNEDMECVIFCTFMPIDVEMYETLLQLYFPMDESKSFPDGPSLTD